MQKLMICFVMTHLIHISSLRQNCQPSVYQSYKKNMNRNIIVFMFMLFICGCYNHNNKDYKETFYHTDGISSYIVEYKNDSIIIFNIRRDNSSFNDTLRMYLKNGVYYTKDLHDEHEELIMSNAIVKDTVFEFDDYEKSPLRRYKIIIKNDGDSIYKSNIFEINPLIIHGGKGEETHPVHLNMGLSYDKDYKIKTITHWFIYETFKANGQ